MLSKFFSFQGRLNRKAYWLRILALILAYVAVIAVLGLVYLVAGAGAGMVAGIVPVVVVLLIAVSSISLAARRLHDRDKSAWWLLVFYIVPVILGIATLYLSLPADLSTIGDPNAPPPAMVMNPATIIMQLASFGLSIWGLIEIGFLKGTIGDNRYGPDPLAGLQ